MKQEDASRLEPGDRVYWEPANPDMIKLQEQERLPKVITVKEKCYHGGGAITITDAGGKVCEAYTDELHFSKGTVEMVVNSEIRVKTIFRLKIFTGPPGDHKLVLIGEYDEALLRDLSMILMPAASGIVNRLIEKCKQSTFTLFKDNFWLD